MMLYISFTSFLVQISYVIILLKFFYKHFTFYVCALMCHLLFGLVRTCLRSLGCKNIKVNEEELVNTKALYNKSSNTILNIVCELTALRLSKRECYETFLTKNLRVSLII